MSGESRTPETTAPSCPGAAAHRTPSRRRKLFCTRLRLARRSPATVRGPQEVRSQRSGQRPEPDPKQPTRVRRRSTAIQEGIEYYGGAWRSPKLIFHDHKGVLLIRQDTDSCPSGVPPQTPPRGSALRGESAPAFSGTPPANRLSVKGGFPFPIARFLLVLHCARVGEEFGYFSGGLHDIITDFRHKRLNGPETQPGDAHGVARIAFLVEHRRGDAYQMGRPFPHS